MLRTILMSSAGVLALTSASFAADLPSRSAPPVAPYIAAPIFTWTGPYIGLEAGGGFTDHTVRTPQSVSLPSAAYDVSTSGAIGGGFVGYNYQFGRSFVVGVEGDIEATSLDDTFLGPRGVVVGGTAYNGYIGVTLPYQASIRARLGYAVGNALFYATGGLALAQFDTNYFTTNAATGVVTGGNSGGGLQTGFTVGGGLEYAFTPNWTVRAEYRYSDYGTFTDRQYGSGNYAFTDALFPGARNPGTQYAVHDVIEHQARIGIAYKFGAPAVPVVAKY